MAEKQIGLRIKLNGLNTVITDIKTLEDEIRKAKEDLKQVEIGSDIFRELATEISQAETKLKGLTQSTEAITREKSIEGFSKLGAGISSSFAAATAAVSLFGTESEEVQKAATDAQNLLTLALSIRGIAELKTGAQIVARTIAEKASTAATNAANAATKSFYTTLAANPYTAILTVVGLLVGAYLSLSNATNEADEAQKEFYQNTAKEASKTIVQYETLTKVVNDQSQSLGARKKALDDLKNLFPGYFKNLKDEEILSGRVKVAIDGVREAIVNRALAQAFEQKLTEKISQNTEARIKLSERELKLRQQEAEVKRQLAKADDDLSKGLINQIEFTNRIAGASSLQNQVASERVGIQKEKDRLDKIDKQNTEGIIISIQQLTESYGDLFTKEEKVTTQTTELTNAQKKNQEVLQNSIKLQVEYIKNLIDTAKELGDVTKVDIAAPKIVKDLENLINVRKQLEVPTLQQAFKDIGLQVEITDGKVKILNDDMKTLEDTFGVFFESQRKALSQGALSQTLEEYSTTVGNILTEASNKLTKGEITKEAFDALKNITEQYQALNKIIQQTPAVKEVFNQGALADYFNITKNLKIAQGEINFEFDKTTNQIKEVSREGINLGIALKDQQDALESFRSGIRNYYDTFYKLDEENFERTVQRLVKEKSLTQKQADEILKDKQTGTKELKKLIDDLAEAQVNSLVKVTNTIIQEENQIRGFLAEAQRLREEGQKLTVGRDISATVLKNIELVRKFAKFQVDETKTSGEQVLQVEKELGEKGLDITKLTEEEKLAIVKFYLQKQKEEKDAAAEDDKKRGKITLESFGETLSQVSSLISRAASIAAQSFQFQLKVLEDSYKNTQSQIVGDTETANKKRAELEEQYQKQKAEIEKRATIRSLQFQLAQAIADGAQAVISVIEVPPLAFIVGALAAAQIALIAEQLQYAQSLAGGGRIRIGAGGMLTGPSHEYGGISYAGGVNLEGGEAVLNRQSSLNYGGLLSTINQMGGGAPIVPNASGSLMEERLIQAIAKTKQEPIRAYVLGSEITNSQAINKRLDELSTL